MNNGQTKNQRGKHVGAGKNVFNEGRWSDTAFMGRVITIQFETDHIDFMRRLGFTIMN